MPQTSSLPLPKSLGETYAVERELGRREGITTYVARDKRDGRRIAINLVLPDVVRPPLLAAELGILRPLQHPNIVRVLDVGHAPLREGDREIVYSITPFVEGETLRERLRREPQLPLDEAVRITGAIGAALTYAHRHGIAHQGVSPDSIILTAGETLLTDFGLARWLLQPGARGEAIPPISWLPYASPEQVTAVKRIDGQTDQYSLACLLYEMLSGTAPFTGPTAQVVLARVVSEPAPRLTSIRVVPRIIERAVERALSKSPRDRFVSVDAFVAALQGASARTPSMAAAPVSAVGRRRWRGPVIGGLVILATVGGIAVASRALADRRPTAAAAHEQLTFTGMAAAPVLSPDGRSVMYIVGGRSLVTQPLDGGEPTHIVPLARRIAAASWTGDGSAIVATMSRDSAERLATYVIPARGGPARKVIDDARPFDAGADPTVIVRAPREGGRLEFVSLESGKTARSIVMSDSIGPLSEVAWSPDGSWVAFADARSGGLWTIPAAGGQPTRIANDARLIRWAGASDAIYFLRGPVGGVDLMRVPIDPASGRAAGDVARVTSLLAADAFDVGTDGRLVHTQATPSAPALTFALGGAAPRGVVEEYPLREGTARVDGAAISPDGRWVAYAARQGVGPRDVHVVAFGGGSARVIAASRGEDARPSWSPDGTRLTFTREDSSGRRVVIADARTGRGEPVGSLPGPAAGDAPTSARWSASGRHIAYYADDRRRIALINLQRRNESTVRVPEYVGGGHYAVIPSPNGTQLLATTIDSAGADPLIWLVFNNGRRWRQVRVPAGEVLPVAWHRNSWIYLVRNRGVATAHGGAHIELWRMRGPTGRAELYARLPDGCGMSVSISADATRGVCNYVRVESDVYVASSIGAMSR